VSVPTVRPNFRGVMTAAALMLSVAIPMNVPPKKNAPRSAAAADEDSSGSAIPAACVR
jgi:hypothetical protein